MDATIFIILSRLWLLYLLKHPLIDKNSVVLHPGTYELKENAVKNEILTAFLQKITFN